MALATSLAKHRMDDGRFFRDKLTGRDVYQFYLHADIRELILLISIKD